MKPDIAEAKTERLQEKITKLKQQMEQLETAKENSWMLDENHRSSGKLLSKLCEEMTKQIKALKGKPQRKFAL